MKTLKKNIKELFEDIREAFIELDNALKCKEKCESRKLCDVHGNLIEYKVIEEK